MTTAQQAPALAGTFLPGATTGSTVRTETVGEYNLLIVEHFHPDGCGTASFSITRCRTYEDGSSGRLVSYGLSGFDDLESAREFGLAWCRDSAAS